MSEENQNEFKVGSYKGKIINCDSGAVGPNNSPLVKVFFQIEGTNRTVPWTGWFSNKTDKNGESSTSRVLKKLVELGFTGECVSELSKPDKDIHSLFNTGKVWNLEISKQVAQDGTVTKYFQIDWINDPEGSGSNKLDYVNSVSVFKGIKGALMQAKRDAGVKTTNNAPSNSAPQLDHNGNEIPF